MGFGLKTTTGIIAGVLVTAALAQASRVFAPLAAALFIIAIVWPIQKQLQSWMPKLVYPLHVGCDFAGLGRFCRNGSKLVVEVEVGSCCSGNEACPATEGQILDRPLDKNQTAALELDYIHQ